jgi:hypothetical protein
MEATTLKVEAAQVMKETPALVRSIQSIEAVNLSTKRQMAEELAAKIGLSREAVCRILHMENRDMLSKGNATIGKREIIIQKKQPQKPID